MRKMALTFLSVFFLFNCLPLEAADSPEVIVVNVVLNQMGKGDYYAVMTGDGDFLLRTEDLKEMGLVSLQGDVTAIEGEDYMSLRSVKGLEFVFDEEMISLGISALPLQFPRQTFDYSPPMPRDVYRPRGNSAFINYGIDYSDSNRPDTEMLNLTNQLGIKVGDVLFMTDSSCRRTATDTKFVRMMTGFSYDRFKEKQRLVAGDFVASSGNLGARVNMVGVSFTKLYKMDPYYIKSPVPHLSGYASLPSDLELYLDGGRIKTENVLPGEFDITNLSYHGGDHLIEMVIRDPFGAVTRIKKSFYYTDQLLRRGVHEYSYNMGVLRREYGIESNEYDTTAFSAFHRVGVTETLTMGYGAEATADVYNLGPTASFVVGSAGVATLNASVSHKDNPGKSGFAGSFRYGYNLGRVGGSFGVSTYTEDYSTINDMLTSDEKLGLRMSIGYRSDGFGSITFNYISRERYSEVDSTTLATYYSRRLSTSKRLYLRFRNVNEEDNINEAYLGMTFLLDRGIQFAPSIELDNNGDREVLHVYRDPPNRGEGYGYGVRIDRNSTDSDTGYNVGGNVEYDSTHGVIRARYDGQYPGADRDKHTYQLSVSGGIAYVGGVVGYSRPVRQSFALVNVGDIEGVSVFVNNREVGETDSSGRLFVPMIPSYYNSQVSLDINDIPINYSLSDVHMNISAPYMGGSVIDFNLRKFQAITGMLRIGSGDKARPVEYVNVKTDAGGGTVFPTIKNGEFYIENITHGTYVSTFTYREVEYTFNLIIPESDEVMIDLGEVIATPRPAPEPTDDPQPASEPPVTP
jgi:outer membrane usher protein FimD/PapC